MVYITRDSDVGDFEYAYYNRRERLIACMMLQGHAFRADNGEVYALLLRTTKGAEGASIVEEQKRRRDGRKAWRGLLAHFEGETYRERLALEAGQILRTSTYSGPKKSFNFGSYYKRHAMAHTNFFSRE